MALGEAGQPCRDHWEQLGTVHVGLLDVGELPTKRSELRAYHGAHQRLKRVEHAALNRSPNCADLDDLHIARREAIGIVAGGLKVDDEHHRGHRIPARASTSDCPPLRSSQRAFIPKACGPSKSQRLLSPTKTASAGAQPSSAHASRYIVGCGLAAEEFTPEMTIPYSVRL